jgi:hypothetical protein
VLLQPCWSGRGEFEVIHRGYEAYWPLASVLHARCALDSGVTSFNSRTCQSQLGHLTAPSNCGHRQ